MIKEKEQLEDSQIETKKAIKEIKRNCHQMFTELRIGSDSSTINLPKTGSTIATQTAINSLSDYSVFIPDRYVSFNASTNCEACGKTFRGYYEEKYRRIGYREPAFYVHCIKECPAYQKLDKIQKCHDCKLLFVNRHSYSWHLKKIHRDSVKHFDGNVYNSSKACPGCNQEFPVNLSRSGKIISRIYSKHCLEECEEYKKLNLIRKCNDCGISFLTQGSLSLHQRSDTNSCTDEQKSMETVVACKGCHKEFLARKNQRNQKIGTFPIKYVRHCLHECPEYQKLGLIRECECRRKFLNSVSLNIHKRNCKTD